MSYNLYQVQMSKAWSERVNKEKSKALRLKSFKLALTLTSLTLDSIIGPGA